MHPRSSASVCLLAVLALLAGAWRAVAVTVLLPCRTAEPVSKVPPTRRKARRPDAALAVRLPKQNRLLACACFWKPGSSCAGWLLECPVNGQAVDSLDEVASLIRGVDQPCDSKQDHLTAGIAWLVPAVGLHRHQRIETCSNLGAVWLAFANTLCRSNALFQIMKAAAYRHRLPRRLRARPERRLCGG